MSLACMTPYISELSSGLLTSPCFLFLELRIEGDVQLFHVSFCSL
jgi:hypothetical protein